MGAWSIDSLLHTTQILKEELEWRDFSGHKFRRVPGWGMEKFLKVSTEEADGIPRVEVQRDRKNQLRTNLPKYVCTPTSQHPSPSSVPIKPRVSNGGVAVSFLLLQGCGTGW